MNSAIIRGQEQSIVVVGLDRAGKSSFKKSLEAGEFVEDVKTTQQPEEHDVFPKDLNMHARMFDMAGQVKFRDWLETLFIFVTYSQVGRVLFNRQGARYIIIIRLSLLQCSWWTLQTERASPKPRQSCSVSSRQTG